MRAKPKLITITSQKIESDYKSNCFSFHEPNYRTMDLTRKIIICFPLSNLQNQLSLLSSGRKFNKHGELTKNWWSSDSLKHFKKRADCVEKQYSNYKVRGKYKVRPSLCTFAMHYREIMVPSVQRQCLFYINFRPTRSNNLFLSICFLVEWKAHLG